ncbi:MULTISPECIES: MFS transporter [Actinomadura]|uniref:MFS transporter n=1 Tax=Actinomadura yumaensis TaxID=111807 RepID=A0ABW2CAT1_9ACTN|nr:MFS transporter [Actinomadura sp. J1-007]
MSAPRTPRVRALPQPGDGPGDGPAGALANPYRPGGRAWAVTAMMVALMVINFADKAVLGLASVPIMDELGLSSGEYGTIASSFYLLFSLSGVIVGLLSNRVRTTWILGVLAFLWSVTSLPLLIAASVPMLYASRIALGAAEGPTSPMTVHAVQKWFPEDRRSVPTALTQMGGALGLAIASPVLVYMIRHHGWRSAFVTLAAAGLVWVALWTVIGREGPLTGAAPESPDADARAETRADAGALAEPDIPYRRLFLNRTWIGGLVAGIGGYWSLALHGAWLPAYLEKVLGHSASETGRIIVLPSLFGAVVLLVVPWLGGVWMRRGASGRAARGIVGGALVVAAGLCVVALQYAPSGWKIPLLTVAFGLPNVIFPLTLLTTSQIVPARRRGSVLATTVAIVTFSGVAAPAVTGRIIDAAATRAAGFEHAYLTAAAILVVCGAVGMLTIDPERDARRLGL